MFKRDRAEPREWPIKVLAARKFLTFIARRSMRIVRQKTTWEFLWSLFWDAAGWALLSWGGFQLHSALGMAIAGLGCFFMAQKLRPNRAS
jgi:hypothetical protein